MDSLKTLGPRSKNRPGVRAEWIETRPQGGDRMAGPARLPRDGQQLRAGL